MIFALFLQILKCKYLKVTFVQKIKNLLLKEFMPQIKNKGYKVCIYIFCYQASVIIQNKGVELSTVDSE